jgi:hypothetical protein
MTFAHPLALLWGLAAIAVVLLYRRRMHAPRLTVGTGHFWAAALAEEPRRAGWLPRRETASLVTQLLIVTLVTLAVAEPQIPRPAQIVLVVDNSASMNAVDEKPSRLAAAKEVARRWVDSLHAYDTMAVLSPGTTPTVHVTLSSRRAQLLAAIDAVTASSGPCRTAETLDVARQILCDQPRGRIVWITDACFPAAAKVAREPGVTLLRVGTAVANAALTRLAVRRSVADPRVCQVLLAAQNLSDQAADSRIKVELDGRPVATVPVKMAANGRWTRVFERTITAGRRITARLEPADAYSTDNQATADVPPLVLQRVTAMGELDRYLAAALAADPRLEMLDAAQAGQDAIRVFAGKVPEQLPPGPLLVLHPAASCDLWECGEPLADPTVARQAEDLNPSPQTPLAQRERGTVTAMPQLRGVRLLDAHLPGARHLKLTPVATRHATELAWTAADEPLVYAIDRPEGRVLVISGDMAAGNFVLDPGFPLLIAQVTEWLAGHARADSGEVACSAESDTQPPVDLRVPLAVGVAADSFTFGRPWWPTWTYLLIAAAVLAAVEWCLYQRRWTA